MKNVDDDTRNYVLQQKIDELESDFYDSPNRLAEDNMEDDFDFTEEFTTGPNRSKNSMKAKKNKKKITTKNKKDAYVKKNFNLKKLIIEEGLDK